MKIIIGLGNPGNEYINTRHNTGYMVVENIKSQESNSKQFKILKSDKFMNNSGSFVKKTLENGKWRMEDLVVVHDDLDIPLGKFKIQFGKGPKDHNGILDVEDKLGTKNFWRVRVGIENRDRDRDERMSGDIYTLENFTNEERDILDQVIKEICKKLETL